jgi:flagellar biosynthesis protein FlhF
MRIKSFVASSVQEALSNIKKEMGESSIILETRNIGDDDIKSESGQNLVEIVAAENVEEKEIGKGEEIKEEGCFSKEEHFPEDDPYGHLRQEISSLNVEWSESCKEWFSLLCEQQVESEDAKVLITEILNELDKESIQSIDDQREKIQEIVVRNIKTYPLETLKEEENKLKVFVGASGI